MPAAPPVPANDKEPRMIRKIVTALILVPLAIVFVALAVANRQTVVSPSIPSIRLRSRLCACAAAVCADAGPGDRRRRGGRHRRLGEASRNGAAPPGWPTRRRASCARRSSASSACRTGRGHRGAETAFHPAGAPGLRPAAQHSASRGLIAGFPLISGACKGETNRRQRCRTAACRSLRQCPS